uniref:Secreted protein n=1 Tax=Panagrellus redivivus TaxID=6233 RepID=A0A7E4UN88_PANRE
MAVGFSFDQCWVMTVGSCWIRCSFLFIDEVVHKCETDLQHWYLMLLFCIKLCPILVPVESISTTMSCRSTKTAPESKMRPSPQATPPPLRLLEA